MVVAAEGKFVTCKLLSLLFLRMRYTGPKCRLCRREGVKLFLKGDRCETQKCAVVKRNTKPGQQGRSSKPTEYAKQLREKQKAKRIYGLTETQFENLFAEASKSSRATGDYMLEMLERRIDSALYRSGLVDSRSQARQLISHGLFMVNGKKVKTPSIRLRMGDKVSLKTEAKGNNFFVNKTTTASKLRWLDINDKAYSFQVTAIPEGNDLEASIESRLIVEYYSRV